MGFGQFSEHGGRRRTKAEMERAVRAIHGAGAHSFAKAGHNRLIYKREDGTRCYRLHYTDVVTVSPDGLVTLDDGGWQTITTRKAMTEGLSALGIGGLYVWGGSHRKADHVLFRSADQREIPFECPFTFTLKALDYMGKVR